MSIKDAFEVFINIFHRGGTQPMEDASHSDPVISMGWVPACWEPGDDPPVHRADADAGQCSGGRPGRHHG